jgi:hypothetical protein
MRKLLLLAVASLIGCGEPPSPIEQVKQGCCHCWVSNGCLEPTFSGDFAELGAQCLRAMDSNDDGWMRWELDCNGSNDFDQCVDNHCPGLLEADREDDLPKGGRTLWRHGVIGQPKRQP